MDQPALSDFIWIDQEEKLSLLWDALSQNDVLALDTESNSFHGYVSQICLLQVATPTQVMLIDTLALPKESLMPFARFLEDPKITKIMHGSDNDIIGLQRDFSLHVNGLFDTVLAARYLNLPKRGLDHLLQKYCGVKASKQYQRFNWKRRPLPSDALRYAAGDAFYLLDVYPQMMQQLEEVGRLEHVFQDSTLLAEREYEEKQFDPDGFWRIKGVKELNPKQLSVFQALYLWRHEVCLDLNMAAFLVLDDRTMLGLARERPTNPQELFRIRSANRSQLRRYCQELIEEIEEGIQNRPPRRPLANRKNSETQIPAKERVFDALRQWRQTTAIRDDLAIDLVATKQMLLNLARHCPTTLEGITQLPGMTPWRIEHYGNDWLAIIQQNIRQ